MRAFFIFSKSVFTFLCKLSWRCFKEVSFQDSDESIASQDRCRRSLRGRNNPSVTVISSTSKDGGPLLSPLLECNAASSITVTTTTCTLSPQKQSSTLAFATPHNRKKKLFTAATANEVISYLIFFILLLGG